ncbi:putative ribonuclease H-like domain-containing protein [Tanacetum coccineum]
MTIVDLKVKVIRCDNGTEFKNKVMNQFCEMKGIEREFSVARTPQQNRVTERKNRTLIEAARTMLADSKLPTTFWAEAVNTACYVQNRVCPITILNTLDHLGKFDRKADERFFVGYSTNSKAFRVFNSRTRIVEENLHVKFSEETSNIVENGPNWLFDIDALTKSMNYKPVVTGNQTNGNAGTKENIDAGQAGKKTISSQEYILLPLLTSDQSLSKGSKDSPDVGFKPSGEEKKKDAKDLENEDSEVPNTEEPRVNQEQDANVNSTNNINTVSPTVNAADIENNVVDENIVYGCVDDPNMPKLEKIVYSDDDEDVNAEADMTNLDTHILVSSTPTTRIHKDHPLEQIIGDIHSAPQTRRMTKNVTEHDSLNNRSYQEPKFLIKMSSKRSEDEELEYPFFEGDGSSSDEWGDYGPPVFDDYPYEEEIVSGDVGKGFVDNYPNFQEDENNVSFPGVVLRVEEESMSVYDTDIEDVTEEEEGFIEKGEFGGEEENIEDVVIVVNDLFSSMIQTTGLRNVNHTQTLDLAGIYERFVYEDNLILRRYPRTKKALITTPSYSPISTAFFSNNIVQNFQEHSDDEADERSSEEYV